MRGLPYVLQLVCDAAGLDAALQLARARGGTRLYVPQVPTPKLEGEIGSDAARVLSERFPNEMVHIPLGPTGSVNAARRLADQAIAQGVSTSQAAARSGLTERAIYKRKAKRRAASAAAQGRLFDEPC